MTGEPVEVETIAPPRDYTLAQLQHACAMAQLIGRGKLVLTLPPLGQTDHPQGQGGTHPS